ncbi:MAG: 2-oxoglutarate dehydrogenase, E2 component, dihydrolipoamide succinyltransferase [Pseudonocardiaceae bacterium]
MAYSVEMPALGESVTEGTVTRWLKHEGDTVEVDEPLVEVSTDKVDTEIPSPAAGVLQRIVVPEDETVEVGAELAVISDSSENSGWQLPEAVAEQAQRPQPQHQPQDQPSPTTDEAYPTRQERRPVAEPSHSGSGSAKAGTVVRMPALGESVAEGVVTRWLKRVGETVEQDEPLLEVSTDKVDTEIPSPVAGTVLEIVVGEDETVEVGAQLATIGEGGGALVSAARQQPERPAEPQPVQQRTEPEPPTQPEPAAQPQPAAQAQPPQPEPAQPEPAQPEPSQHVVPAAQQPATAPAPAPDSDGAGGAPYVTPLVRKLAAEHGVDLSEVQGTGVGGRIRKQDVLAAVAAPEPEPEVPAAQAAQTTEVAVPQRWAQPSTAASALRGKTEKMSRMRSVIAKRMVESLQISAQLTTVVEADITHLAGLRERAKGDFEAREGVKLSFLPFFARATIEALKQHPKLNASIDTAQGEITYHGAEHLGIAVDTERGLLVPVIHDAGDLNIAGLARRIADLAERTRASKITPDEMSGGTFTLSNTGSRGALFDTPIILQPQVGILGTGSVVKRPAVLSGPDGDSIAIRSIMYLALSYDHRLVDGADAARFLNTIKDRLTEAAFETDLGI